MFGDPTNMRSTQFLTFLGRTVRMRPEVRINLWFELLASHPQILKVPTPSYDIPFTEVKHPENYRSPINLSTGDHFPNCCNFHRNVMKEVENWFANFYEQELEYEKLKEASWFDLKQYSYVANKVARQVLFTEYHILNNIPSTDWYEEITDYIEANVLSFGRLPFSFGSPIGLKHYLKYLQLSIGEEGSCLRVSQEVSKDKLEQLTFFVNLMHPDLMVQKKVLLDLYSVYKRWLFFFPFQTNYFRHAFHHFEDYFPPGKGVKYNPYSMRKVGRFKTKTDLENYLLGLTKSLLGEVNSKELVENGRISDFDGHKLEIINERYRIKRARLLGEYSAKETEYLKLLEDWLVNEVEYFEGIEPFVNIISQPKSNDLWYDIALKQGVKDDIINKVRGLFSLTELPEVEKAVRNGLFTNKKYYLGYAKRISIKQLALCYHFLKEANIIQDDFMNGSQYGRSFKAYSEQAKEVKGNSWKQHEKAYNYVLKLMVNKKLTDQDILNVEVARRVLISYPEIQRNIQGFLRNLIM